MAHVSHVISGKWKGRRLALPDDAAVRPSKNLVRQAVFNLLGSRVDWAGLAVADLCCGSGALGIEAASRGAAAVFCVDVKTTHLDANLTALGQPPGITAVTADVLGWAPLSPLDVVLADPPYGTGLAAALLARRTVLGRPGSWWAVETARDDMLDARGFEDVVRRDYGQSSVWVMRQRPA